MKVKIGILTWYYAMNHGARAHTYALLHTLREMGYDAEIIAYHSWGSYKDVEPYWIITRNIPMMYRKIKYRFNFKKTEKEYHYLSRKVHAASEIDKLGYDLIILGSDEIFNISHLITSKDYTYFGVGIETTPMITYAVSCGQSEADTMWPEIVTDSVKRIMSLSVRDINSQRIIKLNTGRTAELVLDPTLLYDFSNLSKIDWKYSDYVLIYTFGKIEEYKSEIVEYARGNNLKIMCIGNFFDWADINIEYPSQAEWYAAFEHSSVVITNSFHGTIFAIKSKKPFANILMDDKVTKISNLLDMFGIRYEDRLLTKTNQLAEILSSVQNYGLIEDKLMQNKAVSIEWLKYEIDRLSNT